MREGPTSFGTEYHIILAASHGARQGAPNNIFDAESCKLRGATDAPETVLLEANRRSIVYWQGELAQALLVERDRHDVAGD